MKDGVLLASGGLDSTVMAYWLLSRQSRIVPLFIDYGQHCASAELSTLKEVLPESLRPIVDVVNIRDTYRWCKSRLIVEPDLWKESVRDEELYIPYRNLVLLSTAAAVAQSRQLPVVYSAFINSNHAKEIDCSRQFFDALTGLLGEYGSVQVAMPFRRMTKSDVARLGLSLNVPIARTFSCQANSQVHCGVCPNCIDRYTALHDLESQSGDYTQPEEVP